MKHQSIKLEIKTKQRNENSKFLSEETLVEIGNKITGTPTTKTNKTNPRRWREYKFIASTCVLPLLLIHNFMFVFYIKECYLTTSLHNIPVIIMLYAIHSVYSRITTQQLCSVVPPNSSYVTIYICKNNKKRRLRNSGP